MNFKPVQDESIISKAISEWAAAERRSNMPEDKLQFNIGMFRMILGDLTINQRPYRLIEVQDG